MSNNAKLTTRDYLLSIQHLFAMFGATVLVPLLTGLNPSLALFSAGVGTLIFHCCTKFKVPVFLGSSFAFLAAVSAIIRPEGTVIPENVPLVQGGIIFAGLVYLLFSLIAYIIGAEKIKKIFPPVVTGPVIVVIGINLAGTAVSDATGNLSLADGVTPAIALNLGIAIFTLFVVILCSIFAHGFFKLVPILIGIAAGYILCIILGALGIYHMDYSAITAASWINIPFVTKDLNGVPFMSVPKFSLGAILSIAPIACVTFMEHIGDITTNGTVVGKDFLKDPGLHRTLMGDGVATLFAGFLGGPANTTYSENTGVLATTKNYNPRLLRVTAVFAIILGLFGKVGAILQTIPGPVKGGVEIMLFGMIAAVGIRSLAESDLDFTHSRNLTIVGLILVFGLGLAQLGGLNIVIGSVTLNISGLFIAVIIGVFMNLILPETPDTARD
ncbi:uracil-xanthine permease family protein [Clostridium boliviensis]|uniref:Uracil-xanthine permease family protein n=1 Tax=Clostridium boliviensis TaxID=318465 RepID=A0ABU4GP30_9CLOT|nr:uracil-xanthine permease family protein [Clostridium boliviensis]MDW2798742.1 uracil-xanthine permease family protein [Clostridium boliviensis]